VERVVINAVNKDTFQEIVLKEDMEVDLIQEKIRNAIVVDNMVTFLVIVKSQEEEITIEEMTDASIVVKLDTEL
jgi:hypothetical protein